jgi:hypothetical protein
MTRVSDRAIARVARQRYWRVDDARIVVAAWRGSGETQARFADRHGIHRKRLGWWIARLQRRVHAPAAHESGAGQPEPGALVRFHPVRVVDDSANHGVEPGADERARGGGLWRAVIDDVDEPHDSHEADGADASAAGIEVVLPAGSRTGRTAISIRVPPGCAVEDATWVLAALLTCGGRR